MWPRTRIWITALAGMATLSALSLLVGLTSEAGANPHVATPSVAGTGTHRLDATVRPHTIGGSGYDLVGSDGGVFVFPTGNPLVGGFFGSLSQLGINVKNIVGITPTDNYRGYDLVGSDGGVFVFPVGQSSGFFGSLPGQGINVNNIVGIAATPDDKGYWLMSTDGIVSSFGDAQNFGDNIAYCAGGVGHYTCIQKLPGARFVGIASTPDGKGYWLVTSTGQVLNLGDAPSLGQTTGDPAIHIVSIVPTSDGQGYWLVASDGGIYAFGDAGFIGSLPGLGLRVNNVVGAVPTVWLQP